MLQEVLLCQVRLRVSWLRLGSEPPTLTRIAARGLRCKLSTVIFGELKIIGRPESDIGMSPEESPESAKGYFT